MLTSMIMSFAMSVAEPVEKPALPELNANGVEQVDEQLVVRKGIRIVRKGIRIVRKGIRISEQNGETKLDSAPVVRKGIRI